MNDRVVETIARLERFMATVDDALALPREAARFAHALILSTGARRAVEVGTSYGYSGLWIGSALAENDGSLITIDRDPRKSHAARSAFEAAGLLDRIVMHTGQAADILATLEGPIDFALNDADKENCILYVELLVNKLTPGAVVLTDNTLTHPGQLAEFMAWIRKRQDFFTVGVPIGNGMDLSVKKSGR